MWKGSIDEDLSGRRLIEETTLYRETVEKEVSDQSSAKGENVGGLGSVVALRTSAIFR